MKLFSRCIMHKKFQVNRKTKLLKNTTSKAHKIISDEEDNSFLTQSFVTVHVFHTSLQIIAK